MVKNQDYGEKRLQKNVEIRVDPPPGGIGQEAWILNTA
jgi:hypothetical protein